MVDNRRPNALLATEEEEEDGVIVEEVEIVAICMEVVDKGFTIIPKPRVFFIIKRKVAPSANVFLAENIF